MNKISLLASLILRVYSINAGVANLSMGKGKKRRKTAQQEAEDQLDKAPWKIDLIKRHSEDDNYRKVA